VRSLRSPVAITAIVAVAALLGLLAYGLSQNHPDRGIDSALARGERKLAPAFDLPRLNGGGRASLAGYRGKVVVLNFWASWCEPCRAEAPILERTQATLTARHEGTVLGATYNDAADHSQAFEREFHVSYPSLRDVGTDLADKFGTRALPETFVLDREGRVVAVSRGQVTQSFLDNALAEARGAGAS
jgi:cytochrome c biogenesis protein CcmG/thiol:disulfide interchange protein DsbE